MVETFSFNTLNQALELRKQLRVIPFAGGTDLMVKRKSWSGTLPKFDLPVLMIGDLNELKGCSITDGIIKIGAAEILTDIARNELVPEILRKTVANMASPAIRNMGTIGGNICNASPAGDTLPVLYAMDATVTLKSVSNSKRVPIKEFIKGPGQTDIADDELMTAVNIPIRDFNKTYYKKLGTRKADALAKLSIAGFAKIKDNMIEDLRIAVGAVAPVVVRCMEAEKMLIGKNIDGISKYYSNIKDIYAKYITPIDDQRSSAAYRKKVSLKLIEDFLCHIAGK